MKVKGTYCLYKGSGSDCRGCLGYLHGQQKCQYSNLLSSEGTKVNDFCVSQKQYVTSLYYFVTNDLERETEIKIITL